MNVRRVLAGVIVVLLGTGVLVGLEDRAVTGVAVPAPQDWAWAQLLQWCQADTARSYQVSDGEWHVVYQYDNHHGMIIMVAHVYGHRTVMCDATAADHSSTVPLTPCDPSGSKDLFACGWLGRDRVIAGDISPTVATLLIRYPGGTTVKATLFDGSFAVLGQKATGDADFFRQQLWATAEDVTGKVLYAGPMG